MPTLMMSPLEAPGNRKEILSGIVTLDGAGTAILTSDCEGFTVARTAAGRFVATLAKPYKKIWNGWMVPEIHATNAAVQDKAIAVALRSVSASGKSMTFQGTLTPTAAAAGADKDFEASTVLRITLIAERGKL